MSAKFHVLRNRFFTDCWAESVPDLSRSQQAVSYRLILNSINNNARTKLIWQHQLLIGPKLFWTCNLILISQFCLSIVIDYWVLLAICWTMGVSALRKSQGDLGCTPLCTTGRVPKISTSPCTSLLYIKPLNFILFLFGSI